MGKIILFDSIKGGVGKSTLVAQFAVALSEKKRVALFDADPQESILDWEKARKAYFEAQGNMELGFRNLAVLSSSLDELRDLKKSFDYVLVDSAGADTKTGRALLLEADIVVCPIQPTQIALNTVLKHSGLLVEASKINPHLRVFYLLNGCSVHSKDREAVETFNSLLELSAFLTKSAENALNIQCVKQFVFDRKLLKTSFGLGLTCFDGKNNKSREEIANCLSEILL